MEWKTALSQSTIQIIGGSGWLHLVNYGFSDASGRGFGSTFQTAEGTGYRIGLWSGISDFTRLILKQISADNLRDDTIDKL